MGKKSASPPKVSEAARIEGEEAREAQRDVTYADRPDQYNPFSQVNWGTEEYIDPATGEPVTKWTQSQSFTDPVQGILDSQLDQLGQRGELSQGMMGRIQSEMGQEADWDQFGQAQNFEYDPTQIRQRAEDAAYQKSASRLDPQFDKRAEALEIKLRNQGLRAGDQAYDAAMSSFDTGRNDAYEQARLGSVQQGQSEADQMWNQQAQSTDMANALRSQQIQEYLDVFISEALYIRC